MSEDKIRKTEADLLSTAINRIVSSDVLEGVITDQLPLANDLTDSNKVYHGKVSMLFVDMRESTKLPEKFSADQLVKIYRGYIRTVVQAIRYSGGVVRDFMGDGVLAAFIDDEEGKSEDKAVRAARYITTAIDKLLNPILEQKMKHRISCGIGIHTGDIFLSKVGMKGKEQQDDAESEFSIAWIGNSTNLACKFSSAVDNGTIFISPSTYSALSDIEGKQEWEKIEIPKGSNVLNGYIAKHYYLQLDVEIESCPAGSTAATVSLADELKKEYQKQLADIARKAEELGKREQAIQEREHQLNINVAEVNQKRKENITLEQDLNKREYCFYCDVLRSGHCERTYVLEMGQDFWEENLDNAIAAGIKLKKDVHKVRQEISYTMVSIYESLGLYDKAYDFLVEQAAGYSWLNLSTVKNIVNNAKRCDRLKSALYMRLAQNDLSPENRREFEEIKDWIVFEYKG